MPCKPGSSLADQRIVTPDDACLPGREVTGPFTAYCQARVIDEHTLDATDGLTYAELDRDDPRRAMAMNSSFLRASLFTSIPASCMPGGLAVAAGQEDAWIHAGDSAIFTRHLDVGCLRHGRAAWGGNFIGVRVSNESLAPFWGAGLRFGLATLLFTAIVVGWRLTWPRERMLARTLGFGALSFGAFYALMYWALTIVAAGVATIVLALVPLTTLLLAASQGQERLRPRSIVGALLALSGIAWMTLGPQDVHVPFAALIAMPAAAACAGQSMILGKKVSANHPAVTNAVGMAAGTVLLLALSVAVGEPWVLPRSAGAVIAVTYLVTLGSVGLFVLLLLIVRRWTSSATSYMFVLFPFATMMLEAVILREPVKAQAVVAAAAVLAGVWFGALSPAARQPAQPARQAQRA